MGDEPNHGGRYAVHEPDRGPPRRRASDRLPEREQLRFSEADRERIIASTMRRVLEMIAAEPTGVQTLDDRRDLASMKPLTTWWNVTTKTLTGVLLLSGVIGAGWAGCVAVRSEMDHAVTQQVAPVRLTINEMRADLRELLRRTPKESP